MREKQLSPIKDQRLFEKVKIFGKDPTKKITKYHHLVNRAAYKIVLANPLILASRTGKNELKLQAESMARQKHSFRKSGGSRSIHAESSSSSITKNITKAERQQVLQKTVKEMETLKKQIDTNNNIMNDSGVSSNFSKLKQLKEDTSSMCTKLDEKKIVYHM